MSEVRAVYQVLQDSTTGDRLANSPKFVLTENKQRSELQIFSDYSGGAISLDLADIGELIATLKSLQSTDIEL